MSTQRKRSSLQLHSIPTNEPATKKQKLDLNIRSSLFSNQYDHYQFEQIFHAIDNSPLIKSINIPRSITKEISEYANGNFVNCSNKKCTSKIPILFEDQQIYSNNHKNANKIGYKWSEDEKQYFCLECMDKTKSNDCGCCDMLHFTPDCDKCSVCKSPVLYECEYNCRCDCHRCWACINCEYKCCDDLMCYDLRVCYGCDEYFCSDCRIAPSIAVCKECYTDKIIECRKCDTKYELLYESNTELCAIGALDCIMFKCYDRSCDVFICLKCDPKELLCNEPSCEMSLGYVCKAHICEEQYLCQTHQTTEKIKEAIYRK